MANTSKPMSALDYQQVIKTAANPDGSIATGSFLAGKVGHKVEREVVSATVDNYHFYDGATLLYSIQVTYNNSDHDELNSAERIS